jgi:hypothetical protein
VNAKHTNQQANVQTSITEASALLGKLVASKTQSEFGGAGVFVLPEYYSVFDATAPQMTAERSLKRAQLLAAAPELLQALLVVSDLVAMFESDDHIQPASLSDHLLNNMTQIRAAIAKATQS